MRMKGKLLLSVSLAAASGCSDNMSGTYADDAGVTRYAFARNGDVKVLVLGAEVDAEYHLDGNKVLISSPQGTVVLTRRDDRLYGPMGLELVRQTDE